VREDGGRVVGGGLAVVAAPGRHWWWQIAVAREAAIARGEKGERDLCEIVFTWLEMTQNITWLNFIPQKVAFTNYNYA